MNPRKLLQLALAALVASAALASTLSHAENYYGNGYTIGVVRPGGDRPCTLFQLVGVDQADPVVPGSPWFVLESTAPGYKEMVATLLTAKASGRSIQLETTGTASVACGHPTVSVLLWM